MRVCFVLLLNGEEIFNMKRGRYRSTAASDPGSSTQAEQVINEINLSEDEEDYNDAYPSSDNESVSLDLDLSNLLEET